MAFARRVLVPLYMCCICSRVATAAFVITTPIDGQTFLQEENIKVAWTDDSPDADPTTQTVRFFKCVAPSTTKTCTENPACGTDVTDPQRQTKNDLSTVLVTNSDNTWSAPEGTAYLCMALDSNPAVFAYSPKILLSTAALGSLTIGPKNIGQFDEVTATWAKSGLSSSASVDLFRCTTVDDPTIPCNLNENCESISPAKSNTGFLRLSSSSSDTLNPYSNDDAYLYYPQFTGVVGTFTMCIRAPIFELNVAGIFSYSGAYTVAEPMLNFEKPNSESCYRPFETAKVKWEAIGGGKHLKLYKCKNKPDQGVDLPCGDNSACHELPGASSEYVLNTGFAYLPSTQKPHLTGAPGAFHLCAASPYAADKVYAYSGKYTVTDDEEVCPLSGGEIAAVSIAGVIVLLCLLGSGFFAWKTFRGDGPGSGGATTTTDAPAKEGVVESMRA